MICKQRIYWTILFSVWTLAVITIWQANREYDIAQNLYISTLEAQDVKNAHVALYEAQMKPTPLLSLKREIGVSTPQIEGVEWMERLSEYPILAKIALCESGLNPNAYSWDGGAQARGLFQITRKYWPDITDTQAFNPDFSLNWAIEKMEANQLHLWTCWRTQFKDY